VITINPSYYRYAVRALKLSAGVLACATVALAIMNQREAMQDAPALEPARNETVVYRKDPGRVSTAQASHSQASQLQASTANLSYEQAEALLEQQDVDQQDVAPSYYQRVVQTIRFLNPNTRKTSTAADESAPRTSVKVGAFVAFPGREVAELSADVSPRKRTASIMDEVDDYLWDVYQRVPVKKDGAGDFTWKDPAAAKRVHMSLRDYVIGGMDPEFREQLYHAGRAMDAAGVEWSLLSAFRDDYRQTLASGFKASTGNSLHGGSRRTGGYGHGRAVDVTGAADNMNEVWQWFDAHGAKYGLFRPMPGYDPAHIQQRGDYHKIAMALRDSRIRVADAARGKDKSKVASASMR
jgi:hypothetical protein